MGNTTSEGERLCHAPDAAPYGFRVFSVRPNSPATTGYEIVENEDGKKSAVPGELVSFLDMIVGINGIVLSTDNPDVFTAEIRRNVNRVVSLNVFNTKSNSTRVMQVIPRKWEGYGLLGMHIRYDSYEYAREHVLHVTDVLPGSPASLAGLEQDTDYILGAEDALFESVPEFSLYLEVKKKNYISLYVYNRERDTVRQVSVLLTEKEWGQGQFGLGCTVSTGFLHRLPNRDSNGKNEWPSLRHQEQASSSPAEVRTAPLASQDGPNAASGATEAGDREKKQAEVDGGSHGQRTGAVATGNQPFAPPPLQLKEPGEAVLGKIVTQQEHSSTEENMAAVPLDSPDENNR